jgi:hypothetical protein
MNFDSNQLVTPLTLSITEAQLVKIAKYATSSSITSAASKLELPDLIGKEFHVQIDGKMMIESQYSLQTDVGNGKWRTLEKEKREALEVSN